jgi:hypothetical protein
MSKYKTMFTKWQIPRIITQDESDPEAVLWNSLNLGVTDQYIHTVKELYRISLASEAYISNYAALLYFTDFNFNVSGTVQGVELEFQSQRLSRINDKIVQLVYNNELIGKNQKLEIAENRQTYGSAMLTWDAELNPTIINSNTFGVAIQLEANKTTPFSELAYIDYVRLRVYYS